MRIGKIGTAVMTFILLATPLLHATAAHTWVASYGNDTNLGTQTSPYADFATAVANTSVGGIVSVLGPGDYGPVTLTQSITIDGTGGGSIGFTGGEGIYIDATSTGATFVIRNLTIDGEGTGSDAIFLASTGPTISSSLVIDGCRLEGFTQIGVGVGSNGPMNVVVRDTTIAGGTLGVRTFQSSGAVAYDLVNLQNVTITGASSAAVFSRNGSMAIDHSVMTESAIAVEADTSAAINVSNSVISFNGTDSEAFSPGVISLNPNNTLFDNSNESTVTLSAHHEHPGPDAPRSRRPNSE
jgi:hypothetical protein